MEGTVSIGFAQMREKKTKYLGTGTSIKDYNHMVLLKDDKIIERWKYFISSSSIITLKMWVIKIYH